MMVHVRSIALLIILVYPYTAEAGVRIAARNRMRNRAPGRCGWCAVQTLARHHHFKALYGLTRKHASRCSAQDLEEAVTKGHVRYRVQYAGKRSKRNTAFLRAAIKKGRGAAVGFRERKKGSGKHIVTLVDWGNDDVQLIDSSDPELAIKTMSKKQFLSYWDGFALVLVKKKPARQRRHVSAR